jgi:hypothetical protein
VAEIVLNSFGESNRCNRYALCLMFVETTFLTPFKQGRVSMEGAVEVDCSVATIGPMCANIQVRVRVFVCLCVCVCVHTLI